MIAFLFFFHGLHEKFIRSASVAFRLYPTSRFSTIFPWLSWLPSTVVTMEIHNSFECCSTLLDGTWWFFVEIFSSSGEKERKREIFAWFLLRRTNTSPTRTPMLETRICVRPCDAYGSLICTTNIFIADQPVRVNTLVKKRTVIDYSFLFVLDICIVSFSLEREGKKRMTFKITIYNTIVKVNLKS